MLSFRGDAGRRAPGEDHRLQERVGSKPVGPVNAGAGHFPAGPKPGQRGSAACIGEHAPHVIMSGWRDRNWLLARIEPGLAAKPIGCREGLGEVESAAIEEGAAAFGDLAMDGACDHVAGAKFRCWMEGLEESL